MRMSILAELLNRIARDPDCANFPAAGQPVANAGRTVPEDVQEFYSLCGGCVIGRGSFYDARIVAPDKVVVANDVILGRYAAIAREEESGDLSWNRYIIAEVENANHLSIDFGPNHTGRCYDSFWDIYGQVGNMPVIAMSFTELLQQLYTHKGEYWYWLGPEALRIATRQVKLIFCARRWSEK
jgi:hypothetical protein